MRTMLVGRALIALATAAAVAPGVIAAASGALPVLYASADLRRGKILYLQCIACHDLEYSGIPKVGPTLAALRGQAAGSVQEFAYSQAMRESGVTWTAQVLDAFIERPSAVVPGTTMLFAGIASAVDRAALVRYVLETAPAE